MAQVSFNYYEAERRISTRVTGTQTEYVDEQINRFIEFLRAQGFAEVAIFHHLDTLVNEFDDNNPGKLDGDFRF